MRVSDYIGNDTIVVIPETVGGERVVEIGGYIFANDSSVKGVFVPNSVTTLSATFPNNDDLEIVICEGVEKILNGAFLNCKNLRTVVLGDSLNELGERAFAGCKTLERLYIAPSLTDIDISFAHMIFYKCEHLIIEGKADSYIEAFCKENGILFDAV